MKLNAPNKTLWIVAVILGVVGMLGGLNVLTVTVVATNAFWLVTIAFVILALTTLMKGV